MDTKIKKAKPGNWFDPRTWTKEQKLWAGGIGVAGAAGLVVFIRRGRPADGAANGSGTPGTVATGTSGYVQGYQGGADTTGNDLASFLGSWGQAQNSALTDSLNQWGGEFKSTLDAIKEGQANGQTGGQTTPGNGGNTGGANSQARSFTVKAGDNVDQSILNYIAAGGYIPAGATAWDYLYKNTGIKTNVNWSPTGDHVTNTFKRPETYSFV